MVAESSEESAYVTQRMGRIFTKDLQEEINFIFRKIGYSSQELLTALVWWFFKDSSINSFTVLMVKSLNIFIEQGHNGKLFYTFTSLLPYFFLELQIR